ncbi:MAG: hypothetical protein HZLCBSQH_000143 [Candidatus Fervidibacterota bacterium]
MKRREFVNVLWDGERIVCLLPLTSPTGRVRVKRGGHPIPTRQTELEAKDVIEWQIAYRDGNGRLVELGQILWLAKEYGVLGLNDVIALEDFASAQSSFCDEQFTVTTEASEQEFFGFKLHRRKHPLLRHEIGDGTVVEIELRHRQRAVGFQAMVFLLIPISQCEPADIIGRKAKPNEKVAWTPSRNVLETLVKAFAIASRSHRDDMLKLLKALKEG